MLGTRRLCISALAVALLCVIAVAAYYIVIGGNDEEIYNYETLYQQYIGYCIDFPGAETDAEEAAFAWDLLESATEIPIEEGNASPGVNTTRSFLKSIFPTAAQQTLHLQRKIRSLFFTKLIRVGVLALHMEKTKAWSW